MQLIVAAIYTLSLSLLLTLVVRSAARRVRMVAQPRFDRWHSRPTALLGGVAIYLSFLIGYLVFAPYSNGTRLILAGGTALFLAGLADDFLHIKPYAKLVVQLVVAAVTVYFGRRLMWTGNEAVNIFITIFWLVGITNAINLLDNMDGLAGGISAIACAFLTATFLLNGQMAQAMMPALLASATLGFLAFNFKPATIFMGDCGSMFLGFTLGATALLSDYDRTRNLGAVLLTPVLILLIPIFDTCVVTVTRKLAGRPVTQGGRDHTSHRLVALGLSERRAVLLLYGLAAASGTFALLVRNMRWEMLFWLVPGFALVVLSIGLYLARVRVYEIGQQPNFSVGSTMLDALTGFTYKRRILEILLDVLLTALAYHGAHLLRFDGGITREQVDALFATMPLVIAVQTLFLLFGGVYRGVWRYVDVEELLDVAKSVIAGTLVSAVVVWAVSGWGLQSKAVFVLYGLLLFVFISASRLSFRVLRAVIVGNRVAAPCAGARPVLIYGADDRGELLIRELLGNAEYNYLPVGFIDDDPQKVGKLIHGVRIFSSSGLRALIERLAVREVLISTTKVPDGKLALWRSWGIEVRRISLRIENYPDVYVPQVAATAEPILARPYNAELKSA